MKKFILLLLSSLLLTTSAYATDWTQDASCEFGYQFTADHNSDSVITDVCGNSLDGTAIGGDRPDWDNSTPASYNVSGSGGGYVTWTTDRITVPNSPSSKLVTTNRKSILWWNNGAAADSARFTHIGGAGGSGQFMITRDPSDELRYCFSFSDGLLSTTKLSGLSAGWHHFAFVTDEAQSGTDRLEIWIDGVAEVIQVDSGDTTSFTNGTTAELILGQRRDGNLSLVNVDTDDWFWFSSALTEPDVNEFYDFGPTGDSGGGAAARRIMIIN